MGVSETQWDSRLSHGVDTDDDSSVVSVFRPQGLKQCCKNISGFTANYGKFLTILKAITETGLLNGEEQTRQFYFLFTCLF